MSKLYDSALGVRTIILHQAGPNFFNVTIGDRHREALTADEALWMIASLLMDREAYGGLRSIEDYQTEAVAQATRDLRPCDKLLKEKNP